MSLAPRADSGRVTVPDILSRKSGSQAGFPDPKPKITCVTAYDYPTARLLDDAPYVGHFCGIEKFLQDIAREDAEDAVACRADLIQVVAWCVPAEAGRRQVARWHRLFDW